MTIRPATGADFPFMAAMLVEAAYPPWTEPKPTPEQAIADARAGLYLRDWGRSGDLGLIAEDEAGRRLGAVLCRHFSAAAPGWGFAG